MNFSTMCIILVAFSPETWEVTLLTITPFAAIRQKSAYYPKFLRIYWTYLDLLYRFGRRISGDDFPNTCTCVFLWRWPKGRCYGHQLNLGDVRKRCVERPLLFASAFNNGLADRKSTFKRFNGNKQATLYPNLVNFRPTISEFSLLERAIFAAIRPQFDNDLHSSRRRCKTDWKITILISAE